LSARGNPGKDSKSKRERRRARRAACSEETPWRRITELDAHEIARKAASLFLDKGYERVTVDDIISLVGGQRRSILAFGGKEDCSRFVIKQFCIDDVAIHSILL